MVVVYYNENDPQCAAWLRELIAQGHLPAGDVDERSIEDVRPADLTGYRQCHFFAGIGGWAYALRLAGWPDDRPVWTGSPPCQPFSSAGRQGGYDDSRHLAPAWLDLVKECRPPVLFGEQVASAATNSKHPWLDDLQDHLEAEDYATGAVVLPACGVGSPHIRQRLWIVAQRVDDPASARHDGAEQGAESNPRDEAWMRMPSEGRGPGGVANTERQQRQRGRSGEASDKPGSQQRTERFCNVGGLADASCERRQQDARGAHGDEEAHGRTRRNGSEPNQHHQPASAEQVHRHAEPGPTNGLWRDADWLYCRDDKWRPVEPGTFPLADGVSARVGRLRGYGNAIVPQVAAAFIAANMEMDDG